MDEKKAERIRRGEVLKTLLVTTLVFFAVLGGLLLLHAKMPELRERSLVSALEAGQVDRARRLAGKLDDEEKARGYLVRCDYLEGRQLMSAGNWEEASGRFAAAAGYEDAADCKRECDYQAACALAQQGAWEAAADGFAALGNYRDAVEQNQRCRMERAISLEESDPSGAAALYASLGDYGDAQQRLRALAVGLTGIEDEEAAVAALQGLTPEMLLRMAELNALRETLPRDIIDVGFYHTIGLAADGGVLACGDDSFGQCQVSGIRDAVAVAAGAYHSVVLHADGTVSAFGRDSEGQCDTADWRNVVQIAAADYATFGLCADGTLLYTGFNDYEKTAGWYGMERVSGGSYNVGSLRADGGAWIYPEIVGGEELTGLVDLAVNTGFGVGVRADGSVVASAFTLDDWNDVLLVSTSGTVVLGLRADGSVLCHAFRGRDRLDLSSVTDAVAIAAGGTHSAVVLSDGSVRVFGESEDGQADTAGWRLAIQ